MRIKHEIVTFKADQELVEAMKGIENRSEFIRRAILEALDNTCPLCGGTGMMTPQQKRHWEQFTDTHSLSECAECHALHLTCESHGRGAWDIHAPVPASRG